TRTTRVLLSNYEIKTPTESYHMHSTDGKIEKIIDYLKEGKNLALVSDAGTPGISDPGSFLVQQVLEAGFKVESVPGASALTTALSILGVPCDQFTFYGFLPHKKGRQTLFTEIKESERTSVFYESPHRIIKSLEALQGTKKNIGIARELTKMFEQVIKGSPEEVLSYFTKNADKVRGEFVVVVY
ncbi:MAG: rRNA small subunit methyltransferase 1, partial [Candidatus Pacebacteria bacterium]|nr:rRNA small subunit methyltransferase 1 [Candidatus Paceibacterota bacterium]